jgi:uncharacterized short protein YbdD (DUF466 family)
MPLSPRGVVGMLAELRAAVPGRAALRRLGSIVQRVIGAPDYDRYRAHMAACHPADTALSREEFERSRLEDKYSRPGQRCC